MTFNKDLRKDFIASLGSSNTKINYCRVVDQFVSFCGADDFLMTTERNAIAYASYLSSKIQKDELTEASKCLYLYALKSAARFTSCRISAMDDFDPSDTLWRTDADGVYENIFRNVYPEHLGFELSDENVLDTDSVCSLLDSVSEDLNLICELILYCGLTEAEVLELKLEHVNMARQSISIHDAKGSSYYMRTVSVPRSIAARLYSRGKEGYAFTGRNGKPLNARWLQRQLAKYDMSPRRLRATGIVQMFSYGLDMKSVRKYVSTKTVSYLRRYEVYGSLVESRFNYAHVPVLAG